MLPWQDVKASDLQKIAVLGSGAFGQVMLVKHEGKYLALKTLSKPQIIEMGLQVRFFGTTLYEELDAILHYIVRDFYE